MKPPFQAFQSFFKTESSGGILLLASTVVALAWANSPWSDSYFATWRTVVTVGFGSLEISKSLLLWINDGLMAIFFFLIGLEIKREMLFGELSSPRQALLPALAAVGGMIVPAGIFLLLNRQPETVSGWGIPMATDIAFALGILALMGRRAPLGLKVFLTAVAIIDDLGAVLVIAFFYTAKISWSMLGLATLFLVALILANRLRVQRTAVYVILGIALWVAFLKSGVHATIAGVLLAMTIPTQRRLDIPSFVKRGKSLLERLSASVRHGQESTNPEQADVIHALEVNAVHAESLLVRLEHALHGWVAFVIIPVFALSNAGVSIGGDLLDAFTHPVTLGVALGLVVGKQIGVAGFSWLAVRTRLAVLPPGIGWRHLYGVSALCGIGFTMALFINGLAYADANLVDLAKVGILAASLISGIWGWIVLTRVADRATGTTAE